MTLTLLIPGRRMGSGTPPPPPPPPPPPAVPLARVVLAVRARLVASLGWPAERVLVAPPESMPGYDPQADQYLMLWPDLEGAVRPVFEGAGRLDVRCTERLQVAVRTRLGTDDAPSWSGWLTDPTLGHLRARWRVWDALAGWFPLDADGVAVAVAPLVPVSGGRGRIDKADPAWGESVLLFDVTYVLALTVPPY